MAEVAARLFVLTGPDLGRSFPVGARATLGRSDECDIVLRDRSISRKHAVLFLEDGRWALEDLGSTNGISRDGQRAQRIALADGDEFKLGDLGLRLRLGAAPAEQEIEFDLSKPAPAPAPPVASPRPPPADAEVELEEGEVEIELEPEPTAVRGPVTRAPLLPDAPRAPRAERRTGFLASDLEQQPFWLRTLVVLLLLVLCAALAYGAYRAMGVLRAG